MNPLPAIPFPCRLVVLVVAGACAGSLANWAIYRLGFRARPISPLSPPDPKAPRRRPFDRVPILGWLSLRRESELHGRGFWIRPMLVEVVMAAGLAWL